MYVTRKQTRVRRKYSYKLFLLHLCTEFIPEIISANYGKYFA